MAYIGSLDVASPADTDNAAQGAGKIRELKTDLESSFPNVSGAVTLTHTQINALQTEKAGLADANIWTNTQTMSGKSILDASGTAAGHASTLNVWLSGNYFTPTGGPFTFTDFADAPQAGAEVELYCDSAHVFTDNANLEVDGDTTWTAEAGDRVLLRAKSTTVFTVHPRKKTGKAVIAKSIGNEQTWQTPSPRVATDSYQNLTGNPIMVRASSNISNANGNATLQVSTDNAAWFDMDYAAHNLFDTNRSCTVNTSGIVPNNHYYRLILSNASLQSWNELR